MLNKDLNAIKNHVADGDVATEVKRLIALGQKEGYILFAGTKNTGLPPARNVGAVHYVQCEGASVIYLRYMYNFDVHYGRLESTSNTPAWDKFILGSDLALENATLRAGQDSNGLYIQATGTNNNAFFVRFDHGNKTISADTMINGAWLGRKTIASWS